jgi:hypothetical protein
VTPSVQYLMIMFLYSTAEHDMNMNVVWVASCYEWLCLKIKQKSADMDDHDARNRKGETENNGFTNVQFH